MDIKIIFPHGPSRFLTLQNSRGGQMGPLNGWPGWRATNYILATVNDYIIENKITSQTNT